MEIDGKESVGAGGFEEVGDEASGDGDTGLVFFVGPGVAVVRDYGGDSARGCAVRGVDHDQHLHDVIVDRFGGGLNDEDVAGAYVFEDFYEGVVVGELEDVGFADIDAEVVADFLGQAFVGRPGQDYRSAVDRLHGQMEAVVLEGESRRRDLILALRGCLNRRFRDW